MKHCVGMEPLLLKHAAPVFSGKHADFCVHLSRLGLDHVRNVHEFKLFPIAVLNVVDFIIRVGFPLTFNSIQSMLKLFIKCLSGFLALPTIAYHFKFLLAMQYIYITSPTTTTLSQSIIIATIKKVATRSEAKRCNTFV